MNTDSVPEGHVQLNLIYKEGESPFYLQIPLDIITSLCLKPRKYLRFLGWCILGIKGDLAVEDGGELERISIEGDLEEEEIYYYLAPNNDFTRAVDLEVIEGRSTVPSEAPRTHNNFCEILLERDVCCVFTGFKPIRGEGLHIIPHRRGSDWFQLIVENRPKDGEEAGLSDINDIRNGMFATLMIHSAFDDREVVILKTPNAILSTADIPKRHERPSMPEQVGYPARTRYTLQWLVTPGPNEEKLICPNNCDAAFKKRTKKPKPSSLLLHYNYGAAAVRRWGKGIETFRQQTNPPRPPVPTAAQSGPQTTTHNRNTTIQKLNAARDASGAGPSNSGPGAGTSQTQQAVDSEPQWDEDDVMLFFWANSKAARDRRKEKEAEQNQRMEQWRAGVNGGSA